MPSFASFKLTGRCCALSLAIVTLAATGCQNKAETVRLPHAAGDYNPPLVLSGSPGRDAAAFAASEKPLTEADWRVLEKLGPRPIWEKIESARKRVKIKHPKDAPPAAPGSPVSTEPAPIDLNTMPATVERIDDENNRIIWVLRSFGGSAVTSSREAATSRRNVTLAAPDLKGLVAVVQQEIGENGKCTALPSENTLVIHCPPAFTDRVLRILDRLDSPPRQVEITAKIFEVTQDFDFQQGTELILGRIASDGTQSAASVFSARRFLDAVTSGTTAPVQGGALKLMQVFDDAGLSVDITFQLLAENGLIEVVSSPRMTVAVGETGYMLAGQELPIQSASLVKGILQTTTRYKPVGVQLYITPQASDEKHVKLHTISIVSSIAGFAPLPTMSDSGGFNEGLINPIIDSREAETSVTVGDGDTLVISGLRIVRTRTRENKIPWLGDVPGLEWLFKNHRTQNQSTDLYFFVTPRMVPIDTDGALR